MNTTHVVLVLTAVLGFAGAAVLDYVARATGNPDWLVFGAPGLVVLCGAISWLLTSPPSKP